MSRTLLATVLVCALSCVAFAGDKEAVNVEQTIKQALASYKDGKTQDAISSLQKAIAAMQKSQQQGLASFFPKAPKGWKAHELESQAMSMQGTEDNQTYSQLTQRFTRESDDLEVVVTLANASWLIEPQEAVLKSYRNPEVLKMLSADPKVKIALLEKDGWGGWKHIQKDDQAEAIAFCNSCLLTIRVDKADEEVLETFWKSMDLKGLAATQAKGVKNPRQARDDQDAE